MQVLERRPDVQARAALVQAHAARLHSAKTDLLPRFGMQFLGGDAELHFAGLPSFGATGGLVGLSAYLPVFNRGRIRANIAATDARLNAAVADYDAGVLKALEDVENAYRMRSALDQRSASLAAALNFARRNEDASSALYEGDARRSATCSTPAPQPSTTRINWSRPRSDKQPPPCTSIEHSAADGNAFPPYRTAICRRPMLLCRIGCAIVAVVSRRPESSWHYCISAGRC